MGGDEGLREFVREALGRGVGREEVRAVLIRAGWSREDAASALDAFAEVDFPIPVPRPRLSLTAREAFEYLVLFGTLYVSAFSLGSLLFQFINLAFPDPLWEPYQTTRFTGAIRWAVSSLVVSTPVFLLTARLNARRLAETPMLRRSPVRRWLTYLTLAVTASILIGDMTGLVYNLLGGEVTVRFFLKVLVVALVAGTAFLYYLVDLRREEVR